MKLFLWKIIALFSVLIGSLGPQVATGYQALETPTDLVETQAAVIPVVTADQSTTVVTSALGADCVGRTIQWGRFDLLLWQHCDMNLQLGSVTAPEVVVQMESPQLPKVTVEKDARKTVSTNFDPWEGSQSNFATLAFSVSLPAFQRGAGDLVRQSNANLSVVLFIQAAQDNSQGTIVIRC